MTSGVVGLADKLCCMAKKVSPEERPVQRYAKNRKSNSFLFFLIFFLAVQIGCMVNHKLCTHKLKNSQVI